MARFQIRESRFGTHPVTVLSDSATGAQAVIAHRGATLLSFRIPHRGGPVDLLDGFATPEELEHPQGARSWIMAPFSNRIPEGLYVFQGESHRFEITQPKARMAIHGLLRVEPFEPSRTEETGELAGVTFACRALRAERFPGYPFDVDVRVRFVLRERSLSLEIAGENVGGRPAPFGCGWHPYFKTSEHGIEPLTLSVPAQGVIRTDDRLIPLEGQAAFAALEDVPDLDFRPSRPPASRQLGGRVLDCCFYGLSAGADGLSRTRIEDTDAGLTLTVVQEGGLMHVFTGDTLAVRRRASVALEPVQFMTNAFNRPETRERIVLPPGQTSTFRFGVEAGSAGGG
jgi:aldose 1-epimerase